MNNIKLEHIYYKKGSKEDAIRYARDNKSVKYFIQLSDTYDEVTERGIIVARVTYYSDFSDKVYGDIDDEIETINRM